MGQSKVLYRVGQAVCRPIMKVFYRYKFIITTLFRMREHI